MVIEIFSIYWRCQRQSRALTLEGVTDMTEWLTGNQLDLIAYIEYVCKTPFFFFAISIVNGISRINKINSLYPLHLS
jgi:hypothetical protein